MLTVACVWVQANVPYGVEYVTRLKAMVSRQLPMPHDFVCLTDQPFVLHHTDRWPIPTVGKLPGWWAKWHLFDPAFRSSGRVLYLDLDVLVVGDLTPIVEFPAPFALVPHAGTFEGRNGKRVVKRYNSSVMVWDAEAVTGLWEGWPPKESAYLWGDQDAIGERRPNEATMPAAWFPRLSEVTGPPFGDAKVILSKKPKNEEAAKRWDWFRERWQ